VIAKQASLMQYMGQSQFWI